MANIFTTITGYVTPEIISKAAKALGEEDKKVKAAIKLILPSLMGKLIGEKENKPLQKIIVEAGQNKVLDKVGDIFEGHGIVNNINFGERIENALIGSTNKEFPKIVAEESGISTQSADRLVGWVSAMLGGHIGKMVADGGDYSEIIGQLKKDFKGAELYLPSKLESMFDMGALLDIDSFKIAHPPKSKGETKKECSKSGAPCKKRCNAWILWLLLALLIIALIVWWKSCESGKKTTASVVTIEEVVESNEIANKPKTGQAGVIDFIVIDLPTGEKLQVHKNSCESKLHRFLTSEEYAKAKNEELEKQWFNFEKIDFEHGSSDKLMEGSEAQLKNIALILKAFPDAKFIVGGFADKTGSPETNIKISQKRANHIKSLLNGYGVSANRISVEAFGEKKATHKESEPDSLRAIDRHVGLRFVK